MAKTANVFTRVDPIIKEQAETVLSQLGVSMATAMEMYLRQIVLQRKIPFEMALPDVKPIDGNALSDEEFNVLMDKAMKDYAEKNVVGIEAFETEIQREFGL